MSPPTCNMRGVPIQTPCKPGVSWQGKRLIKGNLDEKLPSSSGHCHRKSALPWPRLLRQGSAELFCMADDDIDDFQVPWINGTALGTMLDIRWMWIQYDTSVCIQHVCTVYIYTVDDANAGDQIAPWHHRRRSRTKWTKVCAARQHEIIHADPRRYPTLATDWGNKGNMIDWARVCSTLVWVGVGCSTLVWVEHGLLDTCLGWAWVARHLFGLSMGCSTLVWVEHGLLDTSKCLKY